MTQAPRIQVHAALLLVALAIIAVLAPEPWYQTDREHYQELGREVIVPDCSSLHCTRALLPALLEHLPGPSIPKWKAVAVLANTWAAAAVATLALQLGLSARAALLAMWLSGLGFGGLFTLFDPYSSDPLMFALGPTLTTWLLRGQLGKTGVVAALAVFAKEFAAAPLWIWTGVTVLARRWFEAARTGTVALAVTTLWLVLQAALMVTFNYTYGGNPSADVFGGGYIVHWFQVLGARVALGALLTEYGALYLLLPLGFVLAGTELKRLALATVPAVVAFAYVQQPDRALWNFHFIATPLAALVLERVSTPVAGALLVTFALANVRLAAQLPFVPAARYALALSMLIAAGAAVSVWRRRVASEAGHRGESDRVADVQRFSPSYRALLTVSATVAVATLVLLADVAAHRTVERDRGLNRQGYRGEVSHVKSQGEVRVAILGGATAFSPDVKWEQSLGYVLVRFLGQRWRWKELNEWAPVSVVDLSQPNDTAATLVDTLRTFRYLEPDIVCLLTGQNDLAGVRIPAGGRWQSALFRRVGYLPVLPALLTGGPTAPPAPEVPVDQDWIRTARDAPIEPAAADSCAAVVQAYCDAIARAVDYSLSHGQRVLVVSEPLVSEAHRRQQMALRSMLTQRYGGDHRVRYLDLGSRVDLLDPVFSTGQTLTPTGIEEFADGLFTGVYSMVTKT